jgi:hypothetical protein
MDIAAITIPHSLSLVQKLLEVRAQDAGWRTRRGSAANAEHAVL